MSWALSAKRSFSFSDQDLPKSSKANTLVRNVIQSVWDILSSSEPYSRSMFQLSDVVLRSDSASSMELNRGKDIPKFTQFVERVFALVLRSSNSAQKLSS